MAASLIRSLLLKQRRFFSTSVSSSKWKVKQVTTSNFHESLDELKTHISTSDFVAISMEKTGSSSATSWHRVLPFDTAETAYFKARRSAQRFQLLQFAVCPFSVMDSNNLIAHPYNFLLFPRDELKIGMPAYSFSCQTSYLTSMARQGFDFNACIYNGISYLSRAQEEVSKIRLGTASPSLRLMKSSSPPTIADTIFVERIKSRIKHWRKTCQSSISNTNNDEELINSLRNIVLGTEQFRSRPMLVNFSDDLLPLQIPVKSGDHGFTLQRELQRFEEEENKKFRGFREVIDLISASQKPVISHNCLNDCTLIHSKFIAPLPPEVDEFVSSLCSVFPKVLDVSYWMKKIGTMRKVTNIPSAVSYLNNHFFAPVNMEIPDQAPELEDFTNVFPPCSTNIEESFNGDVGVWTNDTRKVNCEHLVFLWGFKLGMTAGMLMSVLRESHDIFSGEFDVKLVDKSCAIVVFWQPGLSKDFLDVMNSEEISGGLKELVSDGLRVTCYETYRTLCRLGLWEMDDLGESLERTLDRSHCDVEISYEKKSSEIHWYNDNVINLDDL
ncbi:Ribonuclease CAF1 [Sesbania bispinosa]|nr:Ribonuclease CAF1 [Sesbania bispinosa]